LRPSYRHGWGIELGRHLIGIRRGGNAFGSVVSEEGGRRLMTARQGGPTCQWLRGRKNTLLGFDPGWAEAETGAGPERFPSAFYSFSISFWFFFPIFCFYFYLLQKCFKSIQTTFRNFLKINAMI
jgi:hypothetical protein